MKKDSLYLAVLLFAFLALGCKNYSKYAIDIKPRVKMDKNLLGIWKAVEDSDKKDFFCVQDFYDISSAFPKFFREEAKTKDFDYYISYVNHAKDEGYHQWTTFLSYVGKERLLNIYYYRHAEAGNAEEKGYLFIKIISVNATHDTLVTASIADTTLKDLTNSKEVRTRVTDNINNPAFYSDTLHFYKVSNYHATVSDSVKK